LKKKFLLDTNILVSSPRSVYVFEDNDVYISDTTLEELDNLKTKPGEVGFNAREAIRVLNILKDKGNLLNGIILPGGGTFKVLVDGHEENNNLPKEWSLEKPDNRIINAALMVKATLVTNDVSMQIKADVAGLHTESLKNEEVSDESLQYTGRTEAYASREVIDDFYKTGLMDVSDLYPENLPKLNINEYLIIKDLADEKHTVLGRFDGSAIKKLVANVKPYDVKPKNVGQQFALDALLAPAEELPLVIIKGSAGTAKTFLALAAGLEQTVNQNLYRRLLIFRPNVKFDDDIGYLKGDEMDKIRPLIRPCMDNLEALLGSKKDATDELQSKVDSLFAKGIVAAEAMAYLRGRSISNNYILIDEAQNMSPLQALGAITRPGIGTKIVMVGDPDQIDNPKLDKRNNGLVYAAEKMLGSKLCAQLSFDKEECVRSPLAAEASYLMNLKK
jgi:PhoH-like ATPase